MKQKASALESVGLDSDRQKATLREELRQQAAEAASLKGESESLRRAYSKLQDDLTRAQRRAAEGEQQAAQVRTKMTGELEKRGGVGGHGGPLAPSGGRRAHGTSSI